MDAGRIRPLFLPLRPRRNRYAPVYDVNRSCRPEAGLRDSMTRVRSFYQNFSGAG